MSNLEDQKLTAEIAKLDAEVTKLRLETVALQKSGGRLNDVAQKAAAALAVVLGVLTAGYQVAKYDYEKKAAEIEKKDAEKAAEEAKGTLGKLRAQNESLTQENRALDAKNSELKALGAEYVTNPTPQTATALEDGLTDAASGLVLLYATEPQFLYGIRDDLKKMHFDAHARHAPPKMSLPKKDVQITYFHPDDGQVAEKIRAAFERRLPSLHAVVEQSHASKAFRHYFEIRVPDRES
jgi:hypothetical protein